MSGLPKQKDDEEGLVPAEYTPQKKRWYILFLTGLIGMVQALIWMCWGTISKAMYFAYPSWNDGDIGLLGNWGEICFLVTAIPASWLVDTHGIKVSGVVCTGVMTLGAGVRCAQWLFLDYANSGTIFKILAHICGILNGSMGPFVVTMPSVVSSLWFSPNERTLATGLSWLMLESGNALGFIIGPLMVHSPNINETEVSNVTHAKEVSRIKYEVMNFMFLHAGLCGFLFLLVILYYPSRPDSLPSFTAGEKREDFIAGLKSIFTNRSALMVVIAFTISQGVQEAYYPVMALNLTPIGVTESTVGWIGFLAALVSSFASLATSYWADRLHGWFKRTLVALIFLAIIFFVWQSLIVMGILPYSLTQLYISTIAGMAVNYACTPFFFELGSEVAYPAGEGLMAGTMTFFWTILGIIYLSVFFFKNIGYTWMNWTMMICLTLTIPFILLIKEQYKRSDIDNNKDDTVKETTKEA